MESAALRPSGEQPVIPGELLAGDIGKLLQEHQRVLDELAGVSLRAASSAYEVERLQIVNAELLNGKGIPSAQ